MWLIDILNKLIEDKIITTDVKKCKYFVNSILIEINQQIQFEDSKNVTRFLRQFDYLKKNEKNCKNLVDFVGQLEQAIKNEDSDNFPSQFNILMENAKKTENFIHFPLSKLDKLVIKYDSINEEMSIYNKLGILYQVYLRLKDQKNLSVKFDAFKEIMIASSIVATKCDHDYYIDCNFLKEYFLNLNLSISLADLEMKHLSKIDFKVNPKVTDLIVIFNQYANSKIIAQVIEESKFYKNCNRYNDFDKKNDLMELVEALQNMLEEKVEVNKNLLKIKLFKPLSSENVSIKTEKELLLNKIEDDKKETSSTIFICNNFCVIN
jgi:hypothetical protein